MAKDYCLTGKKRSGYMKKITLLLVSILFIACGGETSVEKPKRLLSEDEMANIIYDITMVQALRSSLPQVLENNDVDAKKYVFKKYKIDSLTFVQNNTWYAANFEQYEGIMKKVSDKIKKEKDIFTPKQDTAKIKKSEIPGAQAKRDSFRKAAADRLKRQQSGK